MNRITCFNSGGISFRSVDCLFKGDRRVNRVSVYTSDSSSFSPWGCFFLLRLPRSTSIIQGYKCFLIHIRVCHRSWIINIKHTVGEFVRFQSNHGTDTLTPGEIWKKRNSEGTGLPETLNPHLCFAKLFFFFSCMTFSSCAGVSEDSSSHANGY